MISKPKSRRRKFPSFLIIGAVSLLLLWFLLPSRPPVTLPPDQNGYIDLLTADLMVTGKPPDTKSDVDELKAFVTENADALARAREALNKESQVVSDPKERRSSHPMSSRIWKTFVAEGRLAEIENRIGDAANSYIEIIQLGRKFRSNGLSYGSEQIAIPPLEAILDRLTAQQCRQLGSTLEQMEQDQEPFSKSIEREKKAIRASLLHWENLKAYAGSVIQSRSLDPFATFYKQVENQFKAGHKKIINLQVSLAMRAFELETGRKANEWQVLTPDYLKAIPLDPETGTNLIFPLRQNKPEIYLQ